MLKIYVNSEEVEGYVSKIIAKIRQTLSDATRDASKLLASNYRARIKRGVGASNDRLRPVSSSTMSQPIRRGGPDKRIRKNVNASRSVPIVATGATVNSIDYKKGKNKYEFEISSNTLKGDMIFAVNAREIPTKNIKTVRDPLRAESPQLDIVEKEILKQLDRLF